MKDCIMKKVIKEKLNNFDETKTWHEIGKLNILLIKSRKITIMNVNGLVYLKDKICHILKKSMC